MIVLLGHRSVDAEAAAEEARLPRELRRIDAATLLADPAGCGERARRWLVDPGSGDGGGVWLHLDLDVVDPPRCRR